jgi:hypothetical protein
MKYSEGKMSHVFLGKSLEQVIHFLHVL